MLSNFFFLRDSTLLRLVFSELRADRPHDCLQPDPVGASLVVAGLVREEHVFAEGGGLKIIVLGKKEVASFLECLSCLYAPLVHPKRDGSLVDAQVGADSVAGVVALQM